MNCKSLIIVGCMLLSSPALLHAQEKKFNRHDSYEEITAGGGVMIPLKGLSGASASALAFADYAVFRPEGLGFRGGVRYSASNNDISSHFELPLRVAWRSNIRKSKPEAVVDALLPDTYMTYTPARGIRYRTERGSLLSALMCLAPQRIEFNAGIAPGYICGGDVHHESTSYGMNGVTESRSYTVHKKYGFSASVEAGMKLTYYIWRFQLSLSPALHYSLTNNFDISSTTVTEKPSRLFISFSGGLGFIF